MSKGIHLGLEAATAWLVASGVKPAMAEAWMAVEPVRKYARGVKGQMALYEAWRVRFMMISRGIQPTDIKPHLTRFQLKRHELVESRVYKMTRRGKPRLGSV